MVKYVESEGIKEIQGIVISFLIYLPLEILALITLRERLVIMHLVPLVTLGGSKDRSIITGAPTFNNNLWGYHSFIRHCIY